MALPVCIARYLGVYWADEPESEYYDAYAIDRPTARYDYDGQTPIEEDFTRKVSGVDTSDLTRYGAGARGLDYLRIQRKAGSGSWQEHASGWPVYATHGNNVGMVTLKACNCQFDSRGQLTTQVEASGATNLCTIVDGYDPVGNRLTRNLDGNPVTWSYDDLYRLTGQQKAGQVCTYTLDGVGNLKTMWEGGNFPRTFTFNAADRLVTMVEGTSLTTYAWTGYGALESEITGNSTTGYAYNGQDQLAVVTGPSGDKSTYSFDGDGLRRTAQEGNALPTTMVWDGSDYLLLKGPSTDQVVLTLEGEVVACGSKDLLTDPLGSLVKEIGAGASLGSLFQFYPYGTKSAPSPLTTNPFRFVAAYGYYNDSSDRDYVRARELKKKLGRWMQTDPMWPSERALEYAGLSPIQFVDPSGTQKFIRDIGGNGCVFPWPKSIPFPLFCPIIDITVPVPPTCVGITNAYADSYGRTGNKLEQCASCVSFAICAAILGGTLSPLGTPLAICLQCMNSCMADHWRRKDTPKWRHAVAICSRHGSRSKACCLASVDAEQDGYTRCAPACCKPLSLIPEYMRLYFAKEILKCCD